jgi:hypothetical protein
MVTALITILGALVPLLVWWIQRTVQQKDDPSEQNRKRYETIDKDISRALRSGSSEDALEASVHAGADLDELERLQRSHGDQRGSN